METQMPICENQSKTLLTVDEAARRLSLSASYLNKLRCFGGGPVFIRLGKAVRYRPSDLDAWIDNNKRANTASAHVICAGGAS
jgi:excisionase family DNA binding protein